MKYVVIDGNKINSKEELHEHLSRELTLPEYYGGNLDALFDCLTEIDYPVTFTFEATEELSDELGQYAVNLALVLHDASIANPNIIFDFSFEDTDI